MLHHGMTFAVKLYRNLDAVHGGP